MIAIDSKNYIQILYLFTLVFALTACGGGSDGGASNTPVEPDTTNTPAEPETATAMIGAAGGTLVTPARMVSVMIPAGALTEEQEITIELLGGAETLDPFSTTGEMLDADTVGVRLSPEGLTFAVPLTITVTSPITAPSVEEGNLKGFSMGPSEVVLISADGSTEPLSNPVINLDSSTGEFSLTAELSHFSEISWTPYKLSNGSIPATIDVYGIPDELTVGTNIFAIAVAEYSLELQSQLFWNFTDESVAPFNLTSGAGTRPLINEVPHIGTYTCENVGIGQFKAQIKLDLFAPTLNDENEEFFKLNGKLRPLRFAVVDHTFDQSVTCIEEVADGGDAGDDSPVNAGAPATIIESFTARADITEVEVGQTFSIFLTEEINPLFVSNENVSTSLLVTDFNSGDLSGTVTGQNIVAVVGPGTKEEQSELELSALDISGTTLVQELTYQCFSLGTYKPLFQTVVSGNIINGGGQAFEESAPRPLSALGIEITCIASTASNSTSITGGADTTVTLDSPSTVLEFIVSAPTLDGIPTILVILVDNFFIQLESLFANLVTQMSSPVESSLKQLNLTGQSDSVTINEIGAPVANGLSFDATPTDPFVVTAVVSCTAEGASNVTANLTDTSGTLLATDSIQVTCELPPTSAACINATNGLETGFECNVGAGTVAFANVFKPTIDDVPIGGAVGQTVPGGVTLHLPLANSGDIPSEATFAPSGWDGTISPSETPVPALFGLDANHQYLFIQYENGVDLIDLSTPSAAPVYTGLLDFSGREQVAESNVDFVHDYMVMPVHTATDDYLIGCGVDVVRHNFDPTANAGNGDFDAAGVIVSDGTELCRDIWTDVDGDGVAPGFAYTTKTVSKSLKTTKWVEDGSADVTLDGDWLVQGSVGLDDNNRILSGVGGFFGEGTLMGSRGIGESGLWFGPRGNAAPGSIIKVSSLTSFEHVRCVGSLCVAASDGVSIISLLWPDRTVVPSVADGSVNFSSLSSRNMVEAANGNLYQFNVTSSDKLAIGQVSPTGDISGPLLIDISSVCTDPQEAQILDMNHIGILCRNDNLFKVLEFVQ